LAVTGIEVGNELETAAARPAFKFVGNSLCLDFINTLRLRDGKKLDQLQNAEDLLDWCIAAQVVSPAQVATMLEDASARREMRAVFARATELRAALVEMAQSLARGQSASSRTIRLINTLLGEWQGKVELVRSKRGYDKHLRLALTRPIQLLVRIAESAADLLSTGDPALIKKCQSPDCLIYFYDTTRNHTRNWCSMEVCGNRAKAAAHYQRKRQKLA
jgi:predicted RNA-binding Zn ribbon-like protein